MSFEYLSSVTLFYIPDRLVHLLSLLQLRVVEREHRENTFVALHVSCTPRDFPKKSGKKFVEQADNQRNKNEVLQSGVL